MLWKFASLLWNFSRNVTWYEMTGHHISWFIFILDHALTSELVVLNITNNGTRILIWFLESQDKVAILRMSINRKNVVRPLILYHFTAFPKLNLENKSDISLFTMIKYVASLKLNNLKTWFTWVEFIFEKKLIDIIFNIIFNIYSI